MTENKKVITISPRDLVGLLVRASLIEQTNKEIANYQIKLKALSEENNEYWKQLAKKYKLNKEDKYGIDQDNCTLILKDEK